MKTIFTLALGGFISLALLSFSQNITRNKYKALNNGYTFVPSGKLEWNGESKSINSFIMMKGEITNFHWMEFLSDLRVKGDTEKLAICLVDSNKWNTSSSFNNKYVDFYHSHPAYRDFPVVNITKEAAELYCEWLSDHFMPNLEGGGKKLKFRLATHDEWIYAAKGGLTMGAYSWGGPYLTNKEGSQLANYVRFGAENISRDSTGKLVVVRNDAGGVASGDFVDVTAPSQSYWPNGYGLYNMNGNVAELVADKDIVVGGSWKDPGYDVRNESFNPYEGAAPNVGFRVIANAQGSDVPWMKMKKKK
ncbi:MAG: SUMF1/EgtB/PvdO family nonheme iron enzyme [Flavobacteriales bacterium]